MTDPTGAEELASPACYAHEVDPAYMWAPTQARGLKARALRLLRLLRGPRLG